MNSIDLAYMLYYSGILVITIFLYMVARFYRSKLDPSTPLVGFIITTTLLFVVIVIDLGMSSDSVVYLLSNFEISVKRVIIDSLLLVAGIIGSWNSFALYSRMKKVQK